tara:strand:+ start:5242 stop:6033 length:792 start_codon:yes stop_codon:yes gene_type:complete
MKKYFVIGNPVDHSLSPKLHNFWIKSLNLNAIYEKKKIEENEIKNLVASIKDGNIDGINVTVPFKKLIIPFLDQLSKDAELTQSVNTVYLKNNKIIGDNTDIEGFELSIRGTNFDIQGKKVLILGAGGVVPSIILSLIKMKVTQISVCNRTKIKAEKLKDIFKNLHVLNWGETIDPDVVINATSIGLGKNDKLDFNFEKFENVKFFYDVIYNPSETNFLRTGKKLGCKIENGKMMFIYQASASFKLWHNILPKIDNNLIQFIK